MADSPQQENAAAPAPMPTERFQRVLAFASEEADGLGHGYITCQHLLYALACETKGLASAALEKVGITASALHGLLVESAAVHDRIPQGRIDMAEEVRDTIERAVASAREWGHRHLDTEHILYGIVAVQTSVDEMLATLRVEPAQILNILHDLQQTAPSAVVRDEAAHAYRFTLESAWLLSLATDIARNQGAVRVTSLHLLAALLTLAGPAQSLFVETLGISVDDLVRHTHTPPLPPSGRMRIPLNDHVQRILGYAIGEAWNRGHLAVAPLHLAMGLARAERNPALDVLADLGVPQAELLDELERVMPPPTAE